jgi:hypothetical protein
MMITGQKPIRKSKQGSFQVIDIVESMRPITKVIITRNFHCPTKIMDDINQDESGWLSIHLFHTADVHVPIFFARKFQSTARVFQIPDK